MKQFIIKSAAFLVIGIAAAAGAREVRSFVLKTRKPKESANQCTTPMPRDKVLPPGIEAANPASQKYDAHQIVVSRLAWPRQVYEWESRDSSWAPRMESQVFELASQQVSRVVGVRIEDVVCRQMSCSIRISSPKDVTERAFLGIQTPRLADSFSPGGEMRVDGDRVSQLAFIFFSHEHRSPESHLLTYLAESTKIGMPLPK